MSERTESAEHRRKELDLIRAALEYAEVMTREGEIFSVAEAEEANTRLLMAASRYTRRQEALAGVSLLVYGGK